MRRILFAGQGSGWVVPVEDDLLGQRSATSPHKHGQQIATQQRLAADRAGSDLPGPADHTGNPNTALVERDAASSQGCVRTHVEPLAAQSERTIIGIEDDECVLLQPQRIELFHDSADCGVERCDHHSVSLQRVLFVRREAVLFEVLVRCLPAVRLARFLVAGAGKVRRVKR